MLQQPKTLSKRPSFSGLRLPICAAAACLVLAACSEKQQAAAPAQPTQQAPSVQADAQSDAQAASAAPAQPAAPAPGRVLPLDVQAVSPMGLTVRVKQIEMAPDATVLTVSLSLGGDKTIFTSLVDKDTYLRDEAGNRLLIKPPEGNRFLRVRQGETLEGQLVFMGALPANARQAEFVINEGNAPDNDNPGLRLTLPLGG